MCSRFFLLKPLTDDVVDIMIEESLFKPLFACRVNAFADNDGCSVPADGYRP